MIKISNTNKICLAYLDVEEESKLILYLTWSVICGIEKNAGLKIKKNSKICKE